MAEVTLRLTKAEAMIVAAAMAVYRERYGPIEAVVHTGRSIHRQFREQGFDAVRRVVETLEEEWGPGGR